MHLLCPHCHGPIELVDLHARESCRLKPGKMYGLLASVPARNGTPARCIARTCHVHRLYQRFSLAAASDGSFKDQNERKAGAMYLTRGSATNLGVVEAA
jgi:hypothetical protein